MSLQAGAVQQNHSDRWISLAICLQVLLVGMKNMLIQAFELLYDNNDVLNTVLFVTVGIAYILAYLSLGSRMVSFSPMSLAMIAFVAISFAVSALIHPVGIVRYGELLIYFLPYCFLTAFMLTRLITLDWLAYYMERFSYLIIAVAVICVMTILDVGHTTTSDWSTYSMSLSNVIMVGVIWLLYRYFQQGRLIPLIGAFVGILTILLCGSRNPLLAIVAYVVVKTVLKVVSKYTPNRERWIYVIWSAAMILFFLFFDFIMSSLDSLLNLLGIYSRNVNLLSDDLFFDSGRSEIHARLISAINGQPLIGLGIGGDMEIIDWAAHNFYLSVLSTYGYLIGVLLLVTLGIMLILAFRRCHGTAREVLLIYTCLFLPRSFTGNDIWRSDMPWWLLAVIIVILSNPTKKADPYETASENLPESEALS